MKHWMRMLSLIAVVGLAGALVACGGGDDADKSDDASETKAAGKDDSDHGHDHDGHDHAGHDHDGDGLVAVPESGGVDAVVTAYIGQMDEMLETSRKIQDEESAKKYAATIQAQADRLGQIGDKWSEMDEATRGMAIAPHASKMSRTSSALGMEWMRIAQDPVLREAVGDAMQIKPLR